MHCRTSRCSCFCQLIRLNKNVKIRDVLIRTYCVQRQLQSIDEIFNETLINRQNHALISIAPKVSTNINTIISGLDETHSINDRLLNEISKYLKSNNDLIINDSAILLESIAIKISSKTLNSYESTKMYGLLIDILQIFGNNSKLPNKTCIESMITILLSLDCSIFNDNVLWHLLYSLLYFASLYRPVSFETYIKVIEYASTQNTVDNDDFIRKTLHLLVESQHRDQADIDKLASMYLTDYKPKAITDKIESKPMLQSTQQTKLMNIIKEYEGDTLSMDELSELYQNKYNEILSIQTMIDHTLHELINIANHETQIIPSMDMELAVIEEGNQWNDAPATVSIFLCELHEVLNNGYKRYIHDYTIPSIWKKQFNKNKMDSLESCMMNDWHHYNMNDQYKLLLKLSKTEDVTFRVMSILLYSWDTIKVRYDSSKNSWKYILRNKYDNEHQIYLNDKILQSMHQQNVIRLLCTEISQQQSTPHWKLNDTLDIIEQYLTDESVLKFPEISQINYFRNDNNIFPGILDLFKYCDFSWHLNNEQYLSLDGNMISKIQNIISCSGEQGISYNRLCRIFAKQYGYKQRKYIPLKQDLMKSYCHIFDIKSNESNDIIFVAKKPLEVSQINHYHSNPNPIQNICKLLSVQAIKKEPQLNKKEDIDKVSSISSSAKQMFSKIAFPEQTKLNEEELKQHKDDKSSSAKQMFSKIAFPEQTELNEEELKQHKDDKSSSAKQMFSKMVFPEETKLNEGELKQHKDDKSSSAKQMLSNMVFSKETKLNEEELNKRNKRKKSRFKRIQSQIRFKKMDETMKESKDLIADKQETVDIGIDKMKESKDLISDEQEMVNNIDINFEYNKDVTIQCLADLYETNYGILPISRFDDLLNRMGFEIENKREYTLKFMPQKCVPGILNNKDETHSVSKLITIFKPFSFGNQVLNILYNKDNIESDQFYEIFQELYGYQLPLTQKQLYFYLYHQFYPFLTLGHFNAEKQSFSIKGDANCYNRIYQDIEILNADQIKNKLSDDIDNILNDHLDGIEFHEFWKKLQQQRNKLIYIDSSNDESEEIPISIFNEMKQFTIYSTQLMELWKDSSNNPLWEAFVSDNNENIQIFLKKRAEPKRTENILTPIHPIHPRRTAKQEHLEMINLNEYGVVLFGIPDTINEKILREHLNDHLDLYRRKDLRFRNQKHLISIQNIDINYTQKCAFIYFGNELSLNVALDANEFFIGNARITIKRRTKSEKTERPKLKAQTAKDLIQEYLAKNKHLKPMDILPALYDNIEYIQQRMSYKRFRLFLIDECHSFLRLQAPSKQKGLDKWSVIKDIKIPETPNLTDNEQRVLGFHDKLIHTIAQYPYYGLHSDEIVNEYEKETGSAYPEYYRLMQHLNSLLYFNYLERNKNQYIVPQKVRDGIFLQRLLSFFPEGLPITEVAEKYMEFRQSERRKRDQLIGWETYHNEPVPKVLYQLNDLITFYYPYIRARYHGSDDPQNFDINKVILYPKFDQQIIAKTLGENFRGKIYGFNVMGIEDKLDFVLNKVSSKSGINICEFIDEYESIIGLQLRLEKNPSIFICLDQYKIHNFQKVDPVILTRIYPGKFQTKLFDLLKQHELDGIYDDDLDKLWNDRYNDQCPVLKKGENLHRAEILYDKYYDIIKVIVEPETNKIKYDIRHKVIEDNENDENYLERDFKFERIVQNTLDKYKEENGRNIMRWIDFIDYFERINGKSFPSTRSLIRVMKRCNISIMIPSDHRIDKYFIKKT